MNQRKQIAFILLLLMLSTIRSFGQGFIGETEQQIRDDFKDNPMADFHVKHDGKQKYIAVVDNDAQMNFMFNNRGVCCLSVIYMYNKVILDNLLAKFDNTATIINKGEEWISFHKGFTVKISLAYSTKMKTNSLTFYSNELYLNKIYHANPKSKQQ